MALFPLPVKAEMTDRLKMPARVLQFGDGYEQTALAGMNRQQTTWDIEVIISSASQDALFNAFLLEYGQHKSFTWQSPRDTSPQLYRITGDISSTRRNGGGSKPVFFSRRMQFKHVNQGSVVPPSPGNVVLLFATFNGENNSTTFTDIAGNLITIRSGAPRISTAQSVNGDGSLFLDGSSSLSVAHNLSFIDGLSNFEWEIQLRPTVFIPGTLQGILDHRSSITNTPFTLTINDTLVGRPQSFGSNTLVSSTALILNQWQILKLNRVAGIRKILINDTVVASDADVTNYTNAGSLIIGDILNAIAPNDGMFTGYIQYIKHTRFP